MVWTVLFLITKGTTNRRDIVMLETLWKVVEALIDTGLRESLQFHESLHSFSTGRGMGAVMMDL